MRKFKCIDRSNTIVLTSSVGFKWGDEDWVLGINNSMELSLIESCNEHPHMWIELPLFKNYAGLCRN